MALAPEGDNVRKDAAREVPCVAHIIQRQVPLITPFFCRVTYYYWPSRTTQITIASLAHAQYIYVKQ